MTQLSVLNEMRFNTNSVLAKIDHYMGADPMRSSFFNNVTGQGMTLAIAGILIGAGAIIASPAAATAATLAVGAVGATALLTGTGMAVFGKMWNAVRGREIDLEQDVKASMNDKIDVVSADGKAVKISNRDFYAQMENGTFYEKYKGVVSPIFTKHVEHYPAENIMYKPDNVRDYLITSKGIHSPYDLNKEEQAIGKVMAMDSKSKIMNAIGKMRLNVFGNDKKNDNKFDM
jgi:hypothetical protein